MGFGYKGLVFYRNNGWLMKNMDKELTVPKWPDADKWPRIYLPELSAQVWDFDASVVCVYSQNLPKITTTGKFLATKTLLPSTKIRKGHGFGQSLAKKGQIFCKNLQKNK